MTTDRSLPTRLRGWARAHPRLLGASVVAAALALVPIALVTATTLFSDLPVAGGVDPTPSPSASDARSPSARTATPSASAAPAASVSESAAPTPSETLTPPTAESSRITWIEVPFEGTILELIGDGSRFVAVGKASDEPAWDDPPTAWTSSDGTAWDEHAVPNFVFEQLGPDGVPASMGPLVRLGDTLFSFGGTSFIDNFYLAAWRWTDGGAWEVVASQSEFFDGGLVFAVGASDDAIIAARTFPYQGATTWRWMAETSWAKSDLTSTDAPIGIAGLAWSEGTYVAAGVQHGTASIWTSPDGMAWTSATPPGSAETLCALSARPGGGFVALGAAGGRPAAWTSPDGKAWTTSTIEPPEGMELPLLATPAFTCQLVMVGDGLLAAVGIEGGAMLSWMSVDGRAWVGGEPLPANGKIASIGDRLVLVGGVGDRYAETIIMFQGVLER